MARFIEFREGFPSKSGKTRTWFVNAKEGGDQLGLIEWYGPWRCYVFSPNPNTVYERTCLRDIAQFCESETNRHRAKLPVSLGHAERPTTEEAK